MKVKELFSDRTRWTRCCDARNDRGLGVMVDDPSAYSFCLRGAIQRCYGSSLEAIIAERKVCTILLQEGFNDHLMSFNDNQATFEDIKKVIELADI